MSRCSGKFVGLLAFLLSTPVWSDTPSERHGTIEIVQPGIQVRGGFTLTFQHATLPGVRNEGLGSFDLVSVMPWRAGHWTLYVEGNLSPRTDGVATRLPQVNADAGSALDGDGAGRLQVSELRYSRRFGKRLLSLGLIDPTDMLDNSAVANDETQQFLNRALVNNPLIEFPDYTLGLSWHRDVEPNRLDLTAFLGSSHGLADNPDASYAQLVDVGAPGKGVFLALETYWRSRASLLRLGGWLNSAPHPRIDAPTRTTTNQGLYAVYDLRQGNGLWMLRIGMANGAVASHDRFLSLATSWPVGMAEAGVGVAWSGHARHATSDTEDEWTAEAYLRISSRGNLQWTPGIQWLRHPGSSVAGTQRQAAIWVFSLRVNYLF